MEQTGLSRNNNEKYYTKADIVKTIIKQINFISENDLIIEPSAGNGVFIPFIKKFNCECLFYDIKPEHPEIITQDFLQLKINLDKDIHIIGNPPFGRQSSLAIKFIKKCCEFAQSISFILPKSFKKESLKRHFGLYYNCVYILDLPKNSFLVNEKEHDVPCIFMIWKKLEQPREVVQKLQPTGFQFVKKNENPDISFRRVGVNAGTISTEINSKSDQSHYFIKFYGKKFEDFILEFEFDNTVGPRSISKQELLLKIKDNS